jgi:hypothetical protein
MTGRATPIARVRLARSLPRLLALPVLLLVLGLGGIAAGAVVVAGPPGIALIVVGAVVALVGLAAAIVLLSLRLDVEEASIRVRWLGGDRVYELSPGPVTRVRLRGPNASKVRVRSGPFGWGLGRAVLRGEESIHIVRLAPTATIILVPTARGRLAIAPARDEDLLDALARAARARQESEARAGDEGALEAGEPEPAAEMVPPEPEPELEPPRPMTGIERAMLEARLAEEAAMAELAAAAVLEAEAAAELEGAPPADAVEEPVEAPVKIARRRPRVDVPRPGARAAFVLLPLVGAGLAWGAGLASGRMPEPGSDLARLTSFALIMAGPATSVGVVMTLAWWPRLVGVVVTGGLVASVFIGRALIAA